MLWHPVGAIRLSPENNTYKIVEIDIGVLSLNHNNIRKTFWRNYHALVTPPLGLASLLLCRYPQLTRGYRHCVLSGHEQRGVATGQWQVEGGTWIYYCTNPQQWQRDWSDFIRSVVILRIFLNCLISPVLLIQHDINALQFAFVACPESSIKTPLSHKFFKKNNQIELTDYKTRR